MGRAWLGREPDDVAFKPGFLLAGAATPATASDCYNYSVKYIDVSAMRLGRILGGCARMLVLVACILAAGRSAPADAGYLALCTPALSDTRGSVVYTDSSGRTSTLTLDDTMPPRSRCISASLPITAAQVEWMALIGEQTTPQVLALSGIMRSGKFEPRAVETNGDRPDEQPSNRRAAPVVVDLLPFLSGRDFGLEERAQSKVDASGITLRCGAGEKPAGLVLRAPEWRLPLRLVTSLRMTGTGSGSFMVALNRTSTAASDYVRVPLGTFDGKEAPTTRILALPQVSEGAGEELGWTILCPRTSSSLHIAAVSLTAQPAHRQIGRAAWAWSPKRWQRYGAALIADAERWGISRLYISVPVKNSMVASPRSLGRFIAAAEHRGVEVWVADGDPRAVLPAERSKFVARAAAYALYNSRAGLDERIGGIQYDIEPYLVPGYQLHPAVWQDAYVATIRALKPAAAMPIEVVLPFWLGLDPASRKRLLDPLADLVAAVVVMDYRTDPVDIQAFAEPFLAWGMKTGTPVWVALENGRMRDQTMRYFRRAQTGEAWLVPMDHEMVALYLRSPAANPIGTTYAYDHGTTIPGGRISFLGNTDRLGRTAAELEKELRVWSDFRGLAINGVL